MNTPGGLGSRSRNSGPSPLPTAGALPYEGVYVRAYTMARFYLFAWADYEAAGGLSDLVLSCDTLADAETAIKGLRDSVDGGYRVENAQVAKCEGDKLEAVANYWYTNHELDAADGTILRGRPMIDTARWVVVSEVTDEGYGRYKGRVL
jgi:hypothetical protein